MTPPSEWGLGLSLALQMLWRGRNSPGKSVHLVSLPQWSYINYRDKSYGYTECRLSEYDAYVSICIRWPTNLPLTPPQRFQTDDLPWPSIPPLGCLIIEIYGDLMRLSEDIPINKWKHVTKRAKRIVPNQAITTSRTGSTSKVWASQLGPLPMRGNTRRASHLNLTAFR